MNGSLVRALLVIALVLVILVLLEALGVHIHIGN